ncbi:MAG: ArAE-1-C domain-containing protein [Lachnoclostridium sp.]
MAVFRLIKVIKGKINFMKVLKIAAGSSLAILIANVFGLAYSASAGIITLLSIQDTKKETLVVAGKRFLSFVLAVLTAYLLFWAFGYYALTFGLFLLIFISLSYLFRLPEGIPMCSVLVSHFLIEKNMRLAFIGNESLILIIGILIGIVLNLYMPDNTEAVKSDMRLVEEKIRFVLGKLSESISGKSGDQIGEKVFEFKDAVILDENFQILDACLKEAITRAYDNMNNTLLSDTRYYLQYFNMRRNQVATLKRIKEQLCLLTKVPKQADSIALFFDKIREQFHEYNNAEKLLEELEQIKSGYRKEPNPATREEFENRAVLYLILYELENFLTIKRNFVNNMSIKQIKTHWNVS